MQTLEYVVLVDEHDQQIGTAEKLEAHQLALRHRAFSVFILRQRPDEIQLLLQQRQFDKYHCGGLWTNTCCSHPRPGETTIAAGKRRLQEEMGIDAELMEIGLFHYIAEFNSGLTENEMDHVLIGTIDHDNFSVNPSEVAAHRWLSLAAVKRELKQQPEAYTPWFASAFTIVLDHLNC